MAAGHATIQRKERSFADTAEKSWDSFSDRVDDYWDEFCDWLEATKVGPLVWISQTLLRHVTVEAPCIITFCFICVVIHVLQKTVWSNLNTFLAVHDTIDLTRPMQIPSLLTHVIAHDGSAGHIKGNMVHLLLVGPSAEHVYGSQAILLVIVLTALASALAHIVVGSSYTHQLGASGVVFSAILLNSLVAAASGTIPLSFLLTAAMWCGDELIKFVWNTDGVSHHAHLTGAIVGTAFAFKIRGGTQNLQQQMQRPSSVRSVQRNFQSWWRKKTGSKTKAR